MANKVAEQYKTARVKELRSLSRILSNSLPNFSGGPLDAAADSCGAGPPHSDKTPSHGECYYEVKRLLFQLPPESLSGCVPRGIAGLSVELEFSVKVWAKPATEKILIQQVEDPFADLQFNITLSGRCDDDAKRFFASWHLDRDMRRPHDRVQEFMHPQYHFQFGGRHLENKLEEGLDFGPALILESPRLAHPPMEAILGVDFILTNFFPHETHTDIRKKTDYRNLVSRAQQRIWRPYAQALADLCSSPNPSTWSQSLWPQFLSQR